MDKFLAVSLCFDLKAVNFLEFLSPPHFLPCIVRRRATISSIVNFHDDYLKNADKMAVQVPRTLRPRAAGS